MPALRAERTVRRRFPPGWRTDVPVLVALLACTITVAVRPVHVATGVALALLAGLHLATRRYRVRLTPARVAHAAVLLAAVGATVSGLLRWAGFRPDETWHAFWGWLLLATAVGHLVLVRGRLRARLSAGR